MNNFDGDEFSFQYLSLDAISFETDILNTHLEYYCKHNASWLDPQVIPNQIVARVMFRGGQIPHYMLLSLANTIGGNNILVIPVGLAFAEINKNFPAINLYTRDKRHPSKLGTYLAACVIFSSVYKKTPEGNSFLFGLDPNKAKIIQQVAWQVSSDFYTGK